MFDGNKVLSKLMLLGETMFLSSWGMAIDLIVFDMLNFDIILGMDFLVDMNFLSWYGAKIDYKKMKVLFHSNNEEFIFGEGYVLIWWSVVWRQEKCWVKDVWDIWHILWVKLINQSQACKILPFYVNSKMYFWIIYQGWHLRGRLSLVFNLLLG